MKIDKFEALLFTSIVDYTRYYLAVWLIVRWCAVSYEEDEEEEEEEDGATTTITSKLIPYKIALMIPGLVMTHIIMEIIYGTILGPQTLSKVKREQLQKDVKSTKRIQHLIILSFHFAWITTVATYLGMFRPVVVVQDSGESIVISWIKALVVPYIEFWLICFLKDCTSMHIGHRMMHNKNHTFLYNIHLDHHEFADNLNNINGAQINPLDLFIENSIGPFLLVAFKIVVGFKNPQISFLCFYTLVSSEGSAHSLNPYSTCYYCPLIDAILKGNIAHNLHHAKPSYEFSFTSMASLLTYQRWWLSK